MTNGQKLKTAVCLSGHLRLFKYNIEHLRNHLLNNENLDCDIFVHTWKNLDRNVGFTNELEVRNVYNPKKMVIEDSKQFTITPLMHHKNFNFRDINGLLSMFYKIKACNDLKSEYERENGFTYDCVIRIRPDIQLHSRVPIDLTTDLKKLYVPNYGDYCGLNDQFAYSNSEIMNKYCSTYEHITRYLEKGIILNPEFFTLETVKENCLTLERPDIAYNIIWHNGKVWNNFNRHS